MQAMATKKSVDPPVGTPNVKRRKASSGSSRSKASGGDGATPARRAYRSDRRERQAAETRTDVLTAAVRLFGERGWSGTTMAAIAAEAGVAVETVYSGFGSKKALLRQAVDVAVVGDDQPVPLADRPEYRRMAEGPPAERMRVGIELLAAIHGRTAPVWAAMVEAASGDAEVAGWRRENEERRRRELVNSLGLVLERPLDEPTIDVLWALFSTEIYAKLVEERGWDVADYRAAMLRLVICLTS
jgi:AcrR family transcriptional regulator